MKLSDVSIKRPIFTAMIMLAILVFGVVLYRRLSIDQFPNVDFPVVTVTAIYPGADPETMETKIADPIEEAVNSIAGIDILRSTSIEGVAQVFVQFRLGVDLDTATQDVRDRIAAIQQTLPQGAEPPIVQKLDLGAAPIMILAISGPVDDAALSRYAEDILKPGLEALGGVGQLELVGSRAREVHVYVDPQQLRSFGLTVSDVVGALRAQNIDLPGGRITRGERELVVRTNAQVPTIAEMRALSLATIAGSVVRLDDVADVEDGLEEARSVARVDERNAIALIVRKQSGANTVDVADAVREVLPALQRRAPPGVRVESFVDNSRMIRASVDTVKLDLVLGAFLAVAIIFVFLRDWRATFISGLALPISVIGTFAFIKAMGFTLNVITTLALSLSIGILIDDAIVVIENIVRRRTALGEDAKTAAQRGTAEIGLAVLATTLAIVAVFVPVAFMEGMIGQFFYEFGLTVAFAVLLSLFVSFTLTPMLSAFLLTDHVAASKGLSGAIERLLTWVETKYRGVVAWALRHRAITLAIAVVSLVAALGIAPSLGFEFIPPEDRAQFVVKTELPTGTSLEQSAEVALRIADRIREVPGVLTTFTTVGGGVQEKVNASEIYVTLVPRERRAYHQEDVMAHIRRMLGGEVGVLIAVEQMNNVGGGGFRAAPIQLNIRGQDLVALERVSNIMVKRLRASSGFVDVDTTYRSGKPQLDVTIDRARAADVGVLGAQVATTVRTLVAGEVATQFESEGDRYDVRVQLRPELRTSANVIEQAQVRAPSGTLVEVGSLATVTETRGPSQIDRQARQRQITVLANLEGKALGDAINETELLVKQVVPAEMTTDFGGMGKMLGESVAAMGLALFLAVICIYMILASQFESLLHPMTIMTSLPFSMIGAFGLLLITREHMSMFAMIGFIMLMGLVTKNAILLVDFAIQKRQHGEGMFEALENAGATRLRPILMTTAAMIVGMIPVAIGHGDGGEVRRAMGLTVIGGLITSTLLTLVVVPVVYTLVDAISRFLMRIWNGIFGGGKKPTSAGTAAAPAHASLDATKSDVPAPGE